VSSVKDVGMNAKNSRLSESQEDYLEAIFHIEQAKGAARAIDIADRLGVTSASVTGALHTLERRELVNHAPYDVVTLTKEGKRLARHVVKRHTALHAFFVKILALEEDVANDCACKMEHAVSDGVLERFVEFVRFMEESPRGIPQWETQTHSFTGGVI